MKEKGLYVITFLLCLVLGVSLYQQRSVKGASDKPVIGVLQYVSHPSLDEITKGVKEGLEAEGFNEKNSKLLVLNSQGEQNKIQTMGQQLIQKSDVLVGIATPAAQGLANQTKDIPLLMGAISYPEKAGLMADEKHPTTNVTGVSDRSPVLEQLKLMKTLLPQVQKVAVLYSSNEDNAKVQSQEAKKAAATLNLETKDYVVSNTNEIKMVTEKALQECDALYLPTDNTIASGFDTVYQVSQKAKKAIIPSVSDQVEKGGLATVGINQKQLGIETGKMAAAILKGKKVEELPVYVFTKGETVLNEKVAKELGVTFSEELVKEAKDVIK